MDLLYFLVHKARELKVSTEIVNRPDIDDELSRLYDQLLAEMSDLESKPDDTVAINNEDENPQPMMLIRS